MFSGWEGGGVSGPKKSLQSQRMIEWSLASLFWILGSFTLSILGFSRDVSRKSLS